MCKNCPGNKDFCHKTALDWHETYSLRKPLEAALQRGESQEDNLTTTHKPNAVPLLPLQKQPTEPENKHDYMLPTRTKDHGVGKLARHLRVSVALVENIQVQFPAPKSLFWPSKALGTYTVHTYTCRQSTHIHIPNFFVTHLDKHSKGYSKTLTSTKK